MASILYYCQFAAGVVCEHLVDDYRHLFLQFVDELCGIILLVLYVAEFFLPYTSEFGALQQFLAYQPYQLHPRLCGNDALAFPPYVTAAEQRLQYRRAAGGAAYAVFLHGSTQFLVFHKLAGGLHCAQQRCLGVVWWRRGVLLGECGFVGTRLAFFECRQQSLGGFRRVWRCVRSVCRGLLLVGLVLFLLSEDHAVAGVEYLLARNLELYAACLSLNGGGGELTVGVEDGDKAAHHEVIDIALRVCKSRGDDARGYDGVVVGNL